MTVGEGSLREIAPGIHAYLQQGGWGYSNAGLIADGGQSLLVDSLYDLHLTERMLGAMRRVEPAASNIGVLVNTHANGDHCWGNQIVGARKIVSSLATKEEMRELAPRRMALLVRTARWLAAAPRWRRLVTRVGSLGIARASALGEAAEFIASAFGAFDFDGISLTLPDETFAGRLELRVGDVVVELIEVGPAHTRGDVLVVVPRSRVAFAGDILFIGSHPILWEGPVQNWIAACDRLLAMDVDVIVPGHGALTDKEGVARTKAYWESLLDATRRGLASGAAPDEIAREFLGPDYEAWTERGRLAVNVDAARRDLTGDRSARDPIALLADMARFERRVAPVTAGTGPRSPR